MNSILIIGTCVGAALFVQFICNLFELPEKLRPFTYVLALGNVVRRLYELVGTLVGTVVFNVYYFIDKLLSRFVKRIYNAIVATLCDAYESLKPFFNFGAFLTGYFVTIKDYCMEVYGNTMRGIGSKGIVICLVVVLASVLVIITASDGEVRSISWEHDQRSAVLLGTTLAAFVALNIIVVFAYLMNT